MASRARPDLVCMTPRTWLWFVVLILLIVWCLHQPSQQRMAKHIAYGADRVLTTLRKPFSYVGITSGGSSGPSTLSVSDRVRTHGGLMRDGGASLITPITITEGLTDQHYCATRKGGCLKDVKTKAEGIAYANPVGKREAFLRSDQHVNLTTRSGYNGTDAYDQPDGDSQYTQWTHSSWTSADGRPAFTVAGSSFYGDPTIAAYWHEDPVLNPIWPGQDVSQVYPDNLQLPTPKN